MTACTASSRPTAPPGRATPRKNFASRWPVRWPRRNCARRCRRGGRLGWSVSPTGLPRPKPRRRALRQPVAIAAEAKGAIDLLRPGGVFRLTGRADRIEQYGDGTLSILDYKTGAPPTQKDVDAGLAPQLLLEAAMAAQGGFGAELAGQTAELLYWHLSGGIDPGRAMPLFKKNPGDIPAAVLDARDRLCELIDAFDQPGRAYLSRPNPGLAPRFSDYGQLARVAEWSAAGDGDE